MEKGGFLYTKLYDAMKHRIECGELTPGERLPSEEELTKQFGISRDTVRKALSLLEQDGYITRRVARGTFVRYQKSNYPLSRLASFSEQMATRGLIPSSDLLGVELTADLDDFIRNELKLKAGEKVFKLTRIRKGSGTPMAYEIAYVSAACCPDLRKQVTGDSSLYRIYEEVYGLKLQYGKYTIEAEMPEPYLQALLKIRPQTPVLKMLTTVMLEGDVPLYHVCSYHISDRYVFSAVIPR